MCGIVGYVGSREALQVVISGLEKLEYRGYDSAGVAAVENGEIVVTRALGKLQELKNSLGPRLYSSTARTAIGHTRWATHGRPSEANAHPHTAGRVSLIHNGIIENYIELRAELQAKGIHFKSETDTEIAAHLLALHLEEGLKPIEALKKTCDRIRGSFAFVALDGENPESLLVAKTATPIVIGIGENEAFIASDIPALLPYTRRIIILEDGDIAEITKSSINILFEGKPVKRTEQTVTWDPVTAQKGGYKHFMLKEIHDQVTAITDTVRGRIVHQGPSVQFNEINFTEDEIKSITRVVFVACGTAWHACLVAKYYFESFAGIPCEVDYASEFRYRRSPLSSNTLVIAISQSGETADTLGAIEKARKEAKTLAICNVLGSSLVRKVENSVFTQAGPEISVASTKAFTTQLAAAYLLALYFGERRGVISNGDLSRRIEDLAKVPSAISEALKCDADIQRIAKDYYKAGGFIYLGRGVCFPIALEGALKLKEISYIHAEGYPSGEIKHGPLALIDEDMPVVVLLQQSELLYEKSVSNLREVEARAGKLICVTDNPDDKEVRKLCNEVITVPHISEELSPLVTSIPLQLLAYYIAEFNGTDVDLPRNLAKSVTVE